MFALSYGWLTASHPDPHGGGVLAAQTRRGEARDVTLVYTAKKRGKGARVREKA